MSLSVYLIILPCIVCAVFFPIFLLRRSKSVSHRLVALIAAVSAVALFSDSCMVISDLSDRMLSIAELLRILSVPLLLPLLNIYLVSLSGTMDHRYLRTAMLWMAVPLALFASTLLIMVLGMKDSRLYEIVCIYIFKGVLLVEIITLSVYLVREMKLSGFGLIHYARYVRSDEEAAPKQVQTMNIAVIFCLCFFRTAMGREWGIEHEWISALLFLLIAQAFLLFFLTAPLSNLEKIRFRMSFTPMTLANAEEEIASGTVLANYKQLMEKDKFYRTPGITTAMIADRLKTQPEIVAAIIKGQYSTTFSFHINNLRVNFAKQYMKEHPGAKMAEVADECGYDSAQSFCRAFKNIEGISPGQWMAVSSQKQK